MKFTKMQGCGNDYVYVSTFSEKIPEEKRPDLAKAVSDRHFGIGSDGLIFINPSDKADFEMEMYNADGSRSEMCGNGIRCVGKYVFDHGLTDREKITVESFGAVKTLELYVSDGKVKTVRVDMGSPVLVPEKVPVDITAFCDIDNTQASVAGDTAATDPATSIKDKDAVINMPLKVAGEIYNVTCVSMGNPHAVVFVDNVDDFPLDKTGPLFENHPAFPARTNTEFVTVKSDEKVRMRVWERGTGETLACGTGCCATAVACILNGKTGNKVEVEVLGGKIDIEWDRERDIIYMTGPAETVFEGEYEV